jgi:hypothetical protein
MARVLTPARREELALKQLAELGFRVSLYEAPQHLEADVLRGRPKPVFVPGTCHAVVEGRGASAKP